MEHIPTAFWFMSGAGVMVFGVFAGLALIFHATRDQIQMTFREEDDE